MVPCTAGTGLWAKTNLFLYHTPSLWCHLIGHNKTKRTSHTDIEMKTSLIIKSEVWECLWNWVRSRWEFGGKGLKMPTMLEVGILDNSGGSNIRKLGTNLRTKWECIGNWLKALASPSKELGWVASMSKTLEKAEVMNDGVWCWRFINNAFTEAQWYWPL